MPEIKPRLEMHGISKRYGGVTAVDNAELVVPAGSVHALVGENGAGKSTLMKILAGAEAADQGRILLDGVPVNASRVTDALDAGIHTVYQEPHLFQQLSVAENFFVGQEVTRGLMVDWRTQAPRMYQVMDLVGLDRDLAGVPVRHLPIAQQQQVSIAKALLEKGRILILDEPSAILAQSEIDVLFGVIRTLQAEGVSIIYISHRLDELFVIADTVTIMRDGETISSTPIGQLTMSAIVRQMLGDKFEEQPHDSHEAGDVVLQARGISLRGTCRDISLSVRKREVLCLYGLVGSGAAEIGEAIYGVRRLTGGSLEFNGRSYRPRSPGHAKRSGIRMLPANRSSEGAFAFQTIAFNMTIASLGKLSRIPGWVHPSTERGIARSLIHRLRVKTPSESQPLSAMSGGNAQKVILARQLVEHPTLLILAEPTQGVDVGAKEEIHRIIAELSGQGVAILVITTDLAEALRVSDRIAVVRAGRIVSQFSRAASRDQILLAATSGSVT